MTLKNDVMRTLERATATVNSGERSELGQAYSINSLNENHFA